MIAAAIYALAAAGFSVAPIRHAVAEAGASQAPPAPAAPTKGPIPDTPDTGRVKLAKAVARQAAIVVGPPALALWIGWDLWFAIVGFFPRRGRRADG